MGSMTRYDTHREHLENFILELEEKELPFYEAQQNRFYFLWHCSTATSILASVATAILAAVMQKDSFDTYGKIALTVLPIIGSAAATFSATFKFREKEALREDGRIECKDMITNARSLLISAKSEDECVKALQQVRERAIKLEKEQHRRDIALRSDEVANDKGSLK